MTTSKVIEGVFAINKPSGISSAQVIRDLQSHFDPSALFAPWLRAQKSSRNRESYNQQHRRREKRIRVKIGHGGTLDPLATGVLITGIGKGTKSLQDFLECTKTYEAVVLFGADTDTYDRVGKVLRRAPYEHVTKAMVEKALENFRGKFMQLPPLYSALKMNGKPLYEYARQGLPIPKEIERREVEVLSLELIDWMEGGTHNHKAPEESAGHAEINIANKMWKQEGSLPGGTSAQRANEKGANETEALQQFETKKRKLSQHQDDLVHERPPSKYGRKVRAETDDEVIMSGGLAAPVEGNDNVSDPNTPAAMSSPSPPPPTSISKGPPATRLRMTVTSGFYVRSLCHDLGAALGSAALMAELERTRQADFEIGKNVLEYDDLLEGEDTWSPKVEKMLSEWMDNHPDDFGPQRRGGAMRYLTDYDEGSEVKNQKRESIVNSESSPTKNSSPTTERSPGQARRTRRNSSSSRNSSPRQENGEGSKPESGYKYRQGSPTSIKSPTGDNADITSGP